MAVVDSFVKNIKGVHYREFLRIAKKTAAFHRNRVYIFTRGLIKKLKLKKKNYYLLAISHSPHSFSTNDSQRILRGIGI